MVQKFKIVPTIVYGDLYLEFLFRHFKALRLHAKLHGAAGSMQAHNCKILDCCFMIGRGQKSCLLGLVTGLIFCFYVKLFLPSVFISVDFWSNIFCNELNVEFAVLNVKVLGFFWREKSGTLILTSKTVQTHKTNFLLYNKNAPNFVEQWVFVLQLASQHFALRYKGWIFCKK